jgi:hypothetical protein
MMDWHLVTELIGLCVTIASLAGNFLSPATLLGKVIHVVALNGPGLQKAIVAVQAQAEKQKLEEQKHH